jgi:hypothetical protein
MLKLQKFAEYEKKDKFIKVCFENLKMLKL